METQTAWLITGLVIGGCFFIFAVIAICFFTVARQRRKKKQALAHEMSRQITRERAAGRGYHQGTVVPATHNSMAPKSTPPVTLNVRYEGQYPQSLPVDCGHPGYGSNPAYGSNLGYGSNPAYGSNPGYGAYGGGVYSQHF